MRAARAFIVLALAGCSNAAGWTKPGVDAGAATAAYESCRSLAAATIKPEIGINEDIQATHQSDWQRSDFAGLQGEAMREDTTGRAAALVDSCMREKGYARGP